MEEKLKFEIYKYLDRKYSISNLMSFIPLFLIVGIVFLEFLFTLYHSVLITFSIVFLKVYFWLIIICWVVYLFTDIKDWTIRKEFNKVMELIQNKRRKK